MGNIWEKTSAENLVRHRSGTYYLSATVAGVKYRKSLKTTKLAAAKIARDEELEKLRAEAFSGSEVGITTVGSALALIETRTMSASLKSATVRYYRELFKLLRKTLPLSAKAAQWSKDEILAWWKAFSSVRSGSQSNAALQVVKRMTSAMVEAGARRDDPAKSIRGKAMGRASIDQLPSLEVLDQMLDGIRGVVAAHVDESANMIEFLAFSGMRIGEAQALRWEHIGKDWITVRGGAEGTKNNQVRRVPISSRLRELIESMRDENSEGPVFTIQNPIRALRSACLKAGIPRMRIHDLRHWFATHAIERGVDIPTVAKWLGHKDGGVLAMRTYGHIRDDHSLAAAKKLG